MPAGPVTITCLACVVVRSFHAARSRSNSTVRPITLTECSICNGVCECGPYATRLYQTEPSGAVRRSVHVISCNWACAASLTAISPGAATLQSRDAPTEDELKSAWSELVAS